MLSWRNTAFATRMNFIVCPIITKKKKKQEKKTGVHKILEKLKLYTRRVVYREEATVFSSHRRVAKVSLAEISCRCKTIFSHMDHKFTQSRALLKHIASLFSDRVKDGRDARVPAQANPGSRAS